MHCVSIHHPTNSDAPHGHVQFLTDRMFNHGYRISDIAQSRDINIIRENTERINTWIDSIDEQDELRPITSKHHTNWRKQRILDQQYHNR